MVTINFRNATPQTIESFRRISALIAYTTITPLFYEGLITGSEFLTYNAGKLYFALNFYASWTASSPNYIDAYNMANAVKGQFQVMSPTGITKQPDINVWFSRILNIAVIPYIKFVGYRLNV